MASAALPPLPDSNFSGPNVSPGVGSVGSGSVFSGGLPAMQKAQTMIEGGYKMLVDSLPSLAPLAADAVSKLRIAIPNAVGAGAQPGAAPQGNGPGLPPPPQGAQ